MGAIRAHLHTLCPRSLPGLLAASSPLASRPVLGGGRPSRDDAGGRRRGGSASPPVTGGGGTGDWRGVLRRLSPVASLDAQDGVQADAYFHIAYHQERRFGNHREERLAVKHFSVEGHIAENKEDNGRCIVSPILRLQAGTNFASEIVATTLIGLHMSKTCSENGFSCKTADSSAMYTVTSMICCADESYVCSARDDEDKWLIYGFAIVETEDTWEHLLARFKDCKLQLEGLQTIVLNWLGSWDSQDTFSNVLAGITAPVDTGFFCKSADSSTMYTVTSMACCKTEDTWEHLLACFKDYRSCVIFHKLDAGPPQTTKTKSLAELPVLLDEQFCKDSNIDPHLSTIVLNWLGSSESQDTLSDVLAGITSPIDTGFFCKSADSSTMYTVTSMICCVDESYVCFARDDEDKWLIYDFQAVEAEDTWEHLLERFKDCKLQPEVLFFEVIK